MADATINIPAAPAILPDALQKKWTQTYAAAFKDAQADYESESDQHQAARKEANRLVRVPEPKSYADAMVLEGWQFIRREEVEGKLKLVTIDGKKFVFDVPAKPKANTKPEASAS